MNKTYKQINKHKTKDQKEVTKETYPMRINKYLALNNYSTRRGADEMIEKGQVYINGVRAELGSKVMKDDKVEVKQSKKEKKEYVYYAYNKKVGVSTNKDNDSSCIIEVTKFPTKVFPVGRLDKDSHGLIILTNDGRVTDRLLSPSYVHEKEYVVKTEKEVTDKFIENMGNGVKFDKFISKKCKVWRHKNNQGKEKKDMFNIILTEGKKRQIRRMTEKLHHNVIDLQRIRVMNIQLGSLKHGEYRSIEGPELHEFLKSLHLLS